MKSLVRVGVLALILLFLAAGLGFGQNNAKKIYTKGVEYAAQGIFDEAKAGFEKALRIDPLYGSAKRALKVLEDELDQKIKSKTAIHLFKGIAYGEKEQLDDSIVEFNTAIQLNPGDAYAHHCRGIT